MLTILYVGFHPEVCHSCNQIPAYHRLNGGSSPMLMVTVQSHGNGQNFTPSTKFKLSTFCDNSWFHPQDEHITQTLYKSVSRQRLAKYVKQKAPSELIFTFIHFVLLAHAVQLLVMFLNRFGPHVPAGVSRCRRTWEAQKSAWEAHLHPGTFSNRKMWRHGTERKHLLYALLHWTGIIISGVIIQALSMVFDGKSKTISNCRQNVNRW